jgi:hypothetical protein
MAEIELHMLNGQCLNRHIATMKEIKSEVEAWQNHRNNKKIKKLTGNLQITKHGLNLKGFICQFQINTTLV